MTDSPSDADLRWVFGYGSLVYRPAFPFEERALARLDGWERRFWQGSVDHRGVPGAPGRVATLIPSPNGHVYGMAYRITPAERDDILAGLDHREKGGYARAILPVALGERSVRALVYWADERNPQFLGPAPLAEMAAQIVASRGPSGPNTEYVLRLQSTLAEHGIRDPDLDGLALAVRDRVAPDPQGL